MSKKHTVLRTIALMTISLTLFAMPSMLAGNKSVIPPQNDMPDNANISATEAAPTPTPEPTPTPTPEPTPTPDPTVTITITGAGDVTIGGNYTGPTYGWYMREFEEQGGEYEYFLKHFKQIFKEDDLTIVNLEGTLTESTNSRKDNFNFRAPPHMVNVLTSSGVDAVSIANNHTLDFHRAGYMDTVETLENAGVVFFGNEFNTVIEIKGIKVGLFGLVGFNVIKKEIETAIDELKENGAELIIAYFHWGVEQSLTPTKTQQTNGRHAIDHGAHLVLGAHPHSIQGIEVYNGRNIVYSLGNFSFGGSRYPQVGFDAYVFSQTFTFYDGLFIEDNVTHIIPAHTSSAFRERYNNYQPIPAEGEEAIRIMEKIENLSKGLSS